jgi:hypothetical protein
MRLLAVTALTVTGCFGTTGNEALVGAAFETVGFIAGGPGAVEHSRPVARPGAGLQGRGDR